MAVNARASYVEGREFEFQRPNLAQRCKRFATASTSTQVAGSCVVLATMKRRWAPQTPYTLRRSMASTMNGLVTSRKPGYASLCKCIEHAVSII